MQVLLINQTYLPDPVATSQYLGRWAEHLAREGHDVTVLASRHAYQDSRTRHAARETRAEVKVVRVGGLGGVENSRGARVLRFVSFLVASFARGLFLRRPDVIVALTSPPLLPVVGAMLAKLRGARLVIWAMDLHPEAAIAAGLLRENSVTAKISGMLSLWALRGADQVVTLDEHMRARLIAQGIEAARAAVVPLWMQEDMAFDAGGRAKMRRRHGWENKFVVMCAGNHGACHSMETMLAAADALHDEPGIHFCWVGGGSQWRELREHAARNVSFLGYVPREKLAALLSAADLQVVVMGDVFVGLLHPCKVYNILAAARPFLYIGPEQGPIPDVIRAAGLSESVASFRHGDGAGVIRDIRRRARSPGPALLALANLALWQEVHCLENLTLTMGYGRRFPQAVNDAPCSPALPPDYPGVSASAPGGTSIGHGR